MKQNQSKSNTCILPIIEKKTTGEVIIILEGSFQTSHPYPFEPGVYQLRPRARIYTGGPEHGSWLPVYGWEPGVLDNSEMPSLLDLPSLGLEPV